MINLNDLFQNKSTSFNDIVVADKPIGYSDQGWSEDRAPDQPSKPRPKPRSNSQGISEK